MPSNPCPKRCFNCKSWQLRNNSSKVAAILKPETKDENRFVFKSTCYCKEEAIPPQIFSSPRQGVLGNVEESPKKLCFLRRRGDFCGRTKKKGENRRFSYGDDELSGYSSDSDSEEEERNYRALRKQIRSPPRSLENFRRSSGSTDYSRSRSLEKSKKSFLKTDEDDVSHPMDGRKRGSLEKSRKLSWESDEDPNQLISRYLEKSRKSSLQADENFDDPHQLISRYLEKSRKSSLEADENFDGSKKPSLEKNLLSKILEKHKKPSRTQISDSETEKSPEPGEISPKPDLKQISDFRKDHFFETHSTEDFFKSVPEHVCVHRFGLDERFLPEPLHSDVYGMSRCIICDRPMEIPKVNTIDERFNKNGKNIFPKFYKYGLAPKRIYLGNDDKVRIEVKMGGKQECGREGSGKLKYWDNYALRYQKGVV